MDAMFLSLGQSGGNVKYSCNIFSAELKNVCAVISLQDYVFWSYVQEVNWAYIAWNSEWMTGVRFPSGSDIFLFVAASTVCGAHTTFCAMLQGAPFPNIFFSSSQHRQSVGPTQPSVPCCKGLLFPRHFSLRHRIDSLWGPHSLLCHVARGSFSQYIFLFVTASTVCGAHTAFCAMKQGAPFPNIFFSSSQHRQSVEPTKPSVPCCKGSFSQYIFLFFTASTVCGAHTAFCAMLQGTPFPKTFFSSSQHRQSVGPTPPSVPCCKGLLFPRIKLPKCELDHSALSSDQLKIGWRNTSCPTCNCANVHSYL